MYISQLTPHSSLDTPHSYTFVYNFTVVSAKLLTICHNDCLHVQQQDDCGVTVVNKTSLTLESTMVTIRTARFNIHKLYVLPTQCIYHGADKSLARPGMKHARKHVRDARAFNNIEKRDVIKFFFPCKARRRRKFTLF